ncbi:hypothetical protein CEXT_627011 [Caerostris extrusa]|uniref:Uncharacterized protein n=1 Tax=Caerostris extrusa TaxID=172846 RepID=A0AAV4XP87_CAEEX|nr:hypothetical protein CEXT_627011 [Caerostris extrusa]
MKRFLIGAEPSVSVKDNRRTSRKEVHFLQSTLIPEVTDGQASLTCRQKRPGSRFYEGASVLHPPVYAVSVKKHESTRARMIRESRYQPLEQVCGSN